MGAAAASLPESGHGSLLARWDMLCGDHVEDMFWMCLRKANRNTSYTGLDRRINTFCCVPAQNQVRLNSHFTTDLTGPAVNSRDTCVGEFAT